MAFDEGCELIKNWKENTVYISLMQLTLLIVNFFLITIISREYGAGIYGEYASSKSLSVLIGTAIVLSLALVTTKARASNASFSKNIFFNSYYLVIRNLVGALVLLVPIVVVLGRDYIMTSLFLIGFVFNEMVHIALAYFQSQGNFVISSKQILTRTILYGLGAWFIVFNGYPIEFVAKGMHSNDTPLVTKGLEMQEEFLQYVIDVGYLKPWEEAYFVSYSLSVITREIVSKL